MTTDRRLLFVHAHPDDESIVTGATMAKYAAEGADVTLVTCTLGEEGEVIPPELTHLASDQSGGLGKYRIEELDRACLALGVRDHRFLGGAGHYHDSGMMGAPSNDHPDCFWRADSEGAAHQLAGIIREVRPDAVVTYDRNGGYGHPDHIQAHRVTLRAFEMAAQRTLPGTPWRTRKLYAVVQPESVVSQSLRRLRDAPGRFAAPHDSADVGPPTPDANITTRVDASAHWGEKALAMRAHATQITVDGERFALSNGLAQEIRAVEYFTLMRGPAPVPDSDSGGWETDLFA